MKISDIFAQKGEAYFRDRETAYIRELSQRDGIVLSLGGGAVLRPENVAAVKETGLLIHLDTPFYRILARTFPIRTAVRCSTDRTSRRKRAACITRASRSTIACPTHRCAARS